MMELLDQLEAENPEDPALAPKVSGRTCAAIWPAPKDD